MMMMMLMATRTTMTTTMMMMAMIVTMPMTVTMLITTDNANMWSQEGYKKGNKSVNSELVRGGGGGCLPCRNWVSLSVGIISTTVMTTITINSVLRTVG